MDAFVNSLIERQESICIVCQINQIRFYSWEMKGIQKRLLPSQNFDDTLQADEPLVITGNATELNASQLIRLREAMERRTVIIYSSEVPSYLPYCHFPSSEKLEPQNCLATIDEAIANTQAKLDHLSELRWQYIKSPKWH